MVNFLANQNIDYAVTSRRKAFLISTPRAVASVADHGATIRASA